MSEAVAKLAAEVAARLAQHECGVVFAESCTCGMVACELGKIAGISAWLCGSAVTYQSETKTAWLGVDAVEIETHTAVSNEVAKSMAVGVLEKTPQARLSASITGHLGPNAPDGFDGVVFIGMAKRGTGGTGGTSGGAIGCTVVRRQLIAAERLPRQIEATKLVYAAVLDALAG